MYNCALSLGVAGGLFIDGFITMHHSWRTIYYVAIALIGSFVIIVIISFPETSYIRDHETVEVKLANAKTNVESTTDSARPNKRSWVQEIKLFHGTYTSESLLKMMLRPIGLIILPPVLWGSLVMSVTIGALTALTSNVASAFSTYYGMQPWQVGLCFIAAIIGKQSSCSYLSAYNNAC
jgi:MFS family permease